ncbi:MAG: hypothetical protein DHS20C12_06650 [Pseudohongiella sp.]|nr:MAG: hypothetical protein DHS20C12_06650 [Pseudohongiella sp.]
MWPSIRNNKYRSASSLSLLVLLPVCLFSTLFAAELPELDSPSTLSGASTSARFFGGATRDGALTFASSFQSHEDIDLTAEIQVEPAHVGSAGEIYVIAEMSGQFFMRMGDDSFLPWDLQLNTLESAITRQSLATTESISILNQIRFGMFYLADTQVNLYLAYGVSSAPQELYFSGTPITIAIDGYDPLRLSATAGTIIDDVVEDFARDRLIPTLIYPADGTRSAPVILFSHGLGGTRFTAIYLMEHWSARGYAVVSMQHAGSDEAILDVPISQVLESFTSAASLENSIARIEDVSAVLDQLELWNADPQHALYQRLDLTRVGMAGHSFGAVTTQAVSGQTLFTTSSATREPRIQAAIPLSPSLPALGNAEAAFASVDIPWLLMTGTKDDAPVEGVGSDVEGRLGVFPALPEGDFYELVLFDGEHHAFTDRELNASQNARNPAHHSIIKALSTAFWDAMLLDDKVSLNWLRDGGTDTVLQPGDTWQFK